MKKVIYIALSIQLNVVYAQINPSIETTFIQDTVHSYQISSQNQLYLNSNTLTNAFLYAGLSGVPLEKEIVQTYFKNPTSSPFLLGYDVLNAISYAQKLKRNSQIFFSFKNRMHGHAAMDKSLAEFVFLGNKHRQEDTLKSLMPSAISQWNYQQLSVGYSHTFLSQDIVLAGSVSYLNGSQWLELNVPDYKLYTALYGTSVDVDLHASLTQSDPAKKHFLAHNAQGFSVDLYANLPAPILLNLDSSMARFKIELNDLGALYWNSNTQRQVVDTSLQQYQGFNINSYLEDSTYQERFDVLRQIPNSTRTLILPFYIHCSIEKSIARHKYALGLTHRPGAYFYPYVYANGVFSVKEWLGVHAGVNYGAYGRLGGSLGLLFNSPSFQIQLLLMQAEGFIFPNYSMGNAVNFHLSKQF